MIVMTKLIDKSNQDKTRKDNVKNENFGIQINIVFVHVEKENEQ